MHSHWFQQPFCQTFPMAHLMREAFPQHWIRIHSLPESKRYPESDGERQIIFERYSEFGSLLLGKGAPCLIIRSQFVRLPSDAKSLPELDWVRADRPPELMPELDWAPIHRVRDEEDEAWDSWVAHTTWDATAFRALLSEIAEDRRAHIAFLSEVTDCIFIPYDGGADGFSFDTTLLQRLSQEFAPWRSALASGL